MDYSNRVNSKQGGGGVADFAETNAHTRQRVRELLATSVDLEHDPYLHRTPQGSLECKLCATTHINEASYISHLGGKKHHINLAHRKILDDKQNKVVKHGISLNDVTKRKWQSIGRPAFTATKVRHPDSEQLGVSITVQCPNTTVVPEFRIMSGPEVDKHRDDRQYVVVSAEPYSNICIVIPDMEIDKEGDDKYWSYWDDTAKVFYVQFFFK